jgi:uncharacterized protein
MTADATISSLEQLLRALQPVLHPGVVAFCRLGRDADARSPDVIGLFREAESTTLIVPEPIAIENGWPVAFRAAWITLSVHSDLHAVGLTAAVARALAEAGISCNVVAAVTHDHIFVPADLGEKAVSVLAALQTR